MDLDEDVGSEIFGGGGPTTSYNSGGDYYYHSDYNPIMATRASSVWAGVASSHIDEINNPHLRNWLSGSGSQQIFYGTGNAGGSGGGDDSVLGTVGKVAAGAAGKAGGAYLGSAVAAAEAGAEVGGGVGALVGDAVVNIVESAHKVEQQHQPTTQLHNSGHASEIQAPPP
jgi:hypothetical protein